MDTLAAATRQEQPQLQYPTISTTTSLTEVNLRLRVLSATISTELREFLFFSRSGFGAVVVANNRLLGIRFVILVDNRSRSWSRSSGSLPCKFLFVAAKYVLDPLASIPNKHSQNKTRSALCAQHNLATSHNSYLGLGVTGAAGGIAGGAMYRKALTPLSCNLRYMVMIE